MCPGILRVRRLVGILTGILLASGITPIRAQTGPPPSEPVCAAYCNPEQAGVSVVELRWPLAPGAPPERTSAADVLARQSIDVTTYVDGFERKLFAAVDSIEVGKRFRTSPYAGESKGAPASLPGLGRLTITEVVSATTPQPAVPLRLSMAPGAAGGLVVVRVSGLEGGMDYRWRLPAHEGSVVLMCTAVRCPVDRFEKPAGRP